MQHNQKARLPPQSCQCGQVASVLNPDSPRHEPHEPWPLAQFSGEEGAQERLGTQDPKQWTSRKPQIVGRPTDGTGMCEVLPFLEFRVIESRNRAEVVCPAFQGPGVFLFAGRIAA